VEPLRLFLRPLVLLLCLLALLQPVAARELRVGTKLTEPFVLRAADEEWGGISIELWERIAADQGWTFTYRELSLDELLAQTEAGSLDVAVAAFTVTPERELRLDFSHAFYSTGLGVAVSGKGGGWSQALSRLVSPRFLGVVAFLAVLLFVVGSLVWLLERRRNAAQFGGPPLRGIGSGFWWSAVTMTTVGYGDKAPVTWSGRLVALVWMFAAIIVISSITAALTSSLTMSQLESLLAGPQDLAHVQVGTVQGTAAEDMLRDQGIANESYPTITAGLQALRQGHLDAFVYDEPILRYWVLKDAKGAIEVLPWVFERQDYALVLPPGSPLRESINRSLLEILRQAEWDGVLRRHLGSR
jgi:ABC-type amino acid transport substrate-binding protein